MYPKYERHGEFVSESQIRDTSRSSTCRRAGDPQHARRAGAAAGGAKGDLTAISQRQSIVNRVDHKLTDGQTLVGRFDYTRNKINNSVGSFINTNGLGADSITNRDVTNASPTSNRTNVTGMAQLMSVLGRATSTSSASRRRPSTGRGMRARDPR